MPLGGNRPARLSRPKWLTATRAKAAAAEAEARRSAADAARYEKIYKQDEISQQQLDQCAGGGGLAITQATLEKERAAPRAR